MGAGASESDGGSLRAQCRCRGLPPHPLRLPPNLLLFPLRVPAFKTKPRCFIIFIVSPAVVKRRFL